MAKVERSFNEQVYAAVRQIPAGRVATYGQIARVIGMPGRARQVGYAMAACQYADGPVPWHRVINAKGQIAIRKDEDTALDQRWLLEEEGVRFRQNGTVDLARFQWEAGR